MIIYDHNLWSVLSASQLQVQSQKIETKIAHEQYVKKRFNVWGIVSSHWDFWYKRATEISVIVQWPGTSLENTCGTSERNKHFWCPIYLSIQLLLIIHWTHPPSRLPEADRGLEKILDSLKYHGTTTSLLNRKFRLDTYAHRMEVEVALKT